MSVPITSRRKLIPKCYFSNWYRCNRMWKRKITMCRTCGKNARRKNYREKSSLESQERDGFTLLKMVWRKWVLEA